MQRRRRSDVPGVHDTSGDRVKRKRPFNREEGTHVEINGVMHKLRSQAPYSGGWTECDVAFTHPEVTPPAVYVDLPRGVVSIFSQENCVMCLALRP